MARTVAELPPGVRITDYISLGVITKTFPLSIIAPVLSKTGTASVRQRDLPAQVVVYYVLALALYMQSSYREVLRCLLEAVQWLRDPSVGVRVAGKSGISQPVRGLAGSRCGSCTMSWSSRWRYLTREGLGIGIGGW